MIYWLQKDLRGYGNPFRRPGTTGSTSSVHSIPDQFAELLRQICLSGCEDGSVSSPPVIIVTIDTSAFSCFVTPLIGGIYPSGSAATSAQGFHFEEIIEIVRIAGANPYVSPIFSSFSSSITSLIFDILL
jgi:hypothetical protein